MENGGVRINTAVALIVTICHFVQLVHFISTLLNRLLVNILLLLRLIRHSEMSTLRGTAIDQTF